METYPGDASPHGWTLNGGVAVTGRRCHSRRPVVVWEAKCRVRGASDHCWRAWVAREPAGAAVRGGRGQGAERSAGGRHRLDPARGRPRRAPEFLALPAQDLARCGVGAAVGRVRRRPGRGPRRPAGGIAGGPRRDRSCSGRDRRPAGRPAHHRDRAAGRDGPYVRPLGEPVLPGPRALPGAGRAALAADGRDGPRPQVVALAARPQPRPLALPGPGVYARSVLAFSLVCVLFLYLLERTQHWLIIIALIPLALRGVRYR